MKFFVALLAWLFSTTMAGRRHRDIPAPLARGRDRFGVWRRTREVGARIPDELWTLSDEHGLSRTASVLKLDYYSLKKRVAAKSSDSISGPPFSTAVNKPDSFIEVSASSLAPGGSGAPE